MMPTQEQIKKVLIEEFSEELNEFFGGRKTTQMGVSFKRALPGGVRKKVIRALAGAINYTASGDDEVGGFVLALRSAKKNQQQLANLEVVIKQAHKKKFSDLALILVPQVLERKGVDTGLTSSEMTSLKALSKPTGGTSTG